MYFTVFLKIGHIGFLRVKDGKLVNDDKGYIAAD
jgi:hypothetical protein